MRLSGLKLTALGLGALLALSCGSNPAGPTQTPGSETFVVSILGQRGNTSFSPNPAIAAGRMVVFRNTDSVAHRIQLNDSSVDWGTVAPGATSAAFVMPAAGTNYHCTLHPAMIGAVAVSVDTPPPPCQGVYC
jgi:plastocyanin